MHIKQIIVPKKRVTISRNAFLILIYVVVLPSNMVEVFLSNFFDREWYVTVTDDGEMQKLISFFYSTTKVLKHKVDNIKRMCAHPLMPLYLTGGQDGSVQMWEWGHQQVVCTPRPPGTFAKVTRCRFSQHGNKFGIADGDGNLSLWQASLASQSNRSFFVSFI